MPEEDVAPEVTDVAPEPLVGGPPSTSAEEAKSQIGDTKPAPEPVKPEPSEYERQLRTENAQYRKRFEPFEKALGGLDDDVRSGVLELAQLVAQADDDAVRARVAEVFGLALPEGEPNPAETPMTKAEFEQWQQSQQTEAQTRQALEQMVTEAKSHGIERGTPAWHALMGHLQANLDAHEQDPSVEVLSVSQAVEQMLQGLDTYAQSRIDEAFAAKGGVKPAVAGAAPEGAGEITSFADATKAALAAVGARPNT